MTINKSSKTSKEAGYEVIFTVTGGEKPEVLLKTTLLEREKLLYDYVKSYRSLISSGCHISVRYAIKGNPEKTEIVEKNIEQELAQTISSLLD